MLRLLWNESTYSLSAQNIQRDPIYLFYSKHEWQGYKVGMCRVDWFCNCALLLQRRLENANVECLIHVDELYFLLYIGFVLAFIGN